MSVTRRAWTAWVIVCIVWGTTYLAIRICLETVPPLLMGGMRFVLAGWLLIAILAAGGEPGFLAGVLSAQIACVGWALGSAYSRRRGHGEARDENVLATAAFEMLFGGCVLLAAGWLLGEGHQLAFNARTASALVYLIV